MKRALVFVAFVTLFLCAFALADGYYQPVEMADMDLNDDASQWCWARSRESEHFLCFWEAGFGADPNGANVPAGFRVDIDDLLTKAERFWNTNVNAVKMVTVGEGVSQLDRYKMQIYLYYTDDWLATGAGYDDVIGALWVSPMTCQPVGSVIAHEVGHCFQYQVYCDQLYCGGANDYHSGFRYGYPGSNGGNGLWEQCAQWVSFLDYPLMSVDQNELGEWFARSNLAFEHEDTRYESYWLLRYIANRRGADAIGRVWRESRYPEDALAAYCRLYLDGDVEALNDDLFDYACQMVTGALLPEGARSLAKRFKTALYPVEDGWRRVGYASCPETGGFNVIPLQAGARVAFRGLEAGSPLAPDDPAERERFNASDVEQGWRHGVVWRGADGAWHMEEANVPGEAREAYFIVVGAPEALCVNPWDDDPDTDVQFPYEIRME